MNPLDWAPFAQLSPFDALVGWLLLGVTSATMFRVAGQRRMPVVALLGVTLAGALSFAVTFILVLFAIALWLWPRISRWEV